ncbi:hypothetical protein HYALB_00009147 [Hymenoscyphus albidus]|uniref:Uncharacterized protein n=1 Tax=Hymenoscyphus albidus TaxID=595503 RepID=A0A9N9LSB0_9HELO|nr:hypothetical protein HYALB_00009147 [Hymenoscyphus albidus]
MQLSAVLMTLTFAVSASALENGPGVFCTPQPPALPEGKVCTQGIARCCQKSHTPKFAAAASCRPFYSGAYKCNSDQGSKETILFANNAGLIVQ